MNNNFTCDVIGPNYLFFSENIPPLVYYSHLPIAIISLLIGIYVFSKNYRGLSNQIILVTTITFSLWVFLDSIFWASNRGDVIMFVWAIQILIEPIVHASSLYLLYVLLYKKDLSFNSKLVMFLLYFPLIVLTPTQYILTSFDISSCLSQESIYSYYSYFIEFIYTVWLICIGIKKYRNEDDQLEKNKIMYLTISIVVLLLGFSWGAVIGSFTDNWNLAQYGLFGMPIFIGILLYNIVTFKLFEITIIGRNIFIFTLWILIISLITITDIETSRVVTIITFIISLVIGNILIRSGSKSYESEKKARRELEKLSETKDQFLMIAQHNLRIPINNLNQRIESVVHNKNDEINLSIKHLSQIADDFKNMAEMKVGSSILNLSLSKIRPLIENVLKELSIDIEGMMLNIHYPSTMHDNLELKIDSHKIREVLLVILENAVRYNVKNGKIEITTEADKNTFKISIYNTGLGITKEEKENLFNRSFYRSKRTKSFNPVGMGIGLSVSKSIIEAHNGNINIDSEGEGKGVTVTILLPIDFYL